MDFAGPGLPGVPEIPGAQKQVPHPQGPYGGNF